MTHAHNYTRTETEVKVKTEFYVLILEFGEKTFRLQNDEIQGLPCTVSEDQYHIPSKEHYGNEFYLTGQTPPSKCCQPLDFWYTFLKGLDL